MTADDRHQAETDRAIEATFRIERARLIAGLARIVRSVDRAEELAQDALVVGFSIWEVKDMDEAMAWVKRSPVMPGMKGEMEIRPFYEAADLGAFVTPEELSAPRDGERGKLGVA